MRVVIDTNVLVSSLRSRRGASFRLVRQVGTRRFEPLISPPLCLEYEDVLHRPGLLPAVSPRELDDFLDDVPSRCVECRIHFLWRPFLPDPKDDMVLEPALAGGARHVVTHNVRDFRGVHTLGIRVPTPDQFLSILSGP